MSNDQFDILIRALYSISEALNRLAPLRVDQATVPKIRPTPKYPIPKDIAFRNRDYGIELRTASILEKLRDRNLSLDTLDMMDVRNTLGCGPVIAEKVMAWRDRWMASKLQGDQDGESVVADDA